MTLLGPLASRWGSLSEVLDSAEESVWNLSLWNKQTGNNMYSFLVLSLTSLCIHTSLRAIFLRKSQAVHQQHRCQDVSARAAALYVSVLIDQKKGGSASRRNLLPRFVSVSLQKRTAPRNPTNTSWGGGVCLSVLEILRARRECEA